MPVSFSNTELFVIRKNKLVFICGNPDWQIQKTIEFKVPHDYKEEIPGICVIYAHQQWLPS